MFEEWAANATANLVGSVGALFVVWIWREPIVRYIAEFNKNDESTKTSSNAENNIKLFTKIDARSRDALDILTNEMTHEFQAVLNFTFEFENFRSNQGSISELVEISKKFALAAADCAAKMKSAMNRNEVGVQVSAGKADIFMENVSNIGVTVLRSIEGIESEDEVVLVPNEPDSVSQIATNAYLAIAGADSARITLATWNAKVKELTGKL